MTISWQTAAAMLEHLEWCLTSDQKAAQMYKDPNSSTCVKVNIFPLEKTNYTLMGLRELFNQHGIDCVRFIIALKAVA